ncbi:MAG: 16S rRNA (adenine(1518)-N(6)/adenine(1519)-N(6))-dimethyltransferase RsmA [Candidatus Hadarchaeales archaeon]
MELRERLAREGIRLSRRYGQHLVVDRGLLQRMVDYAEVSGRDTVLEVGAGPGGLTLLLARRAGEVIAVERDPRLVSLLRRALEEEGCGNVRILRGDVLRLPLPPFNKVVSNLPYSISSDLTFRLLEEDFEVAVLMYQLEFARRLVARPGSEEYGRLTVSTFRRAEVEILEEVPPSSFFPRPKVRSAVVRLRPRKTPPFRVEDEERFQRVLRVLFHHPRQKVRNALYHSFTELFPRANLDKRGRREVLEAHVPGELAEARAKELPPEELARLSDLLGGVERELHRSSQKVQQG